MGASHSTKLYDPLILAQNSIKNKRFVNTSTTSEGYSCYYYYDGCTCDQFYSNPTSPSLQGNNTLKQKKSSLKHGKADKRLSSSSTSKRVHFKQGGNKKYTISPQKEEKTVIMNSPFRGLRRTNSGNSNGYPYPRTHTTVMVIPSNNRASGGSSRNGEWSSTSSIADDSPTSSLSAINFDVSNTGPSYGFDKRRPPLNRAIPPIPESKSNESIMSQASKSLAGTPCEPKQPTLELVQEVIEDKSVVIENKMAQNLATKIATNIPPPPQNHTVPSKPLLPPTSIVTAQPQSSVANNTKATVASSKIKAPKEITKQSKIVQAHADPSKSPLLSMAHSVRSRLTKFGTRFTRSDSHSRSPIRSSTSLISMNKPSQIPKTKMAKSSSMEATRNIPSTSALTKTSIASATTTASENETNTHASLPRSQITLIPSPCRSPRAFAPELPKTTKSSEERINLPSTIQEESTVTSEAEPSKKQATTVITSPVSVATTTTSSNTDTIYSGRVSSSTRPITSPDWSEASNAKTTAPSITTTTAAILTSPEKDKSAVENIPPPPIAAKIVTDEKVNMISKKNSKESLKTKSPSTPRSQKSEKTSKTPKLAAKFGFGGNKSSKTQKVLPSPKIKVKKGSLILKGTSEERRTEEIVKTPRKSLSFEAAQTKPVEVRRNSEMKLIKRIEKTFIPLMPNSAHHKVDNNKNIDMRNMNVRSVNMRNRRAPLAEFESTRVENSPAVELPPIGFDRLTSSPGQRRRAQQTTAAVAAAAATKIPSTTTTTTTTFMHDSNGNVVSVDVSTNLSDFGTKENNIRHEAAAFDNGVVPIFSHDKKPAMTNDNFDKTHFNGDKKNAAAIILDNQQQQLQRMETSADSFDEPKASTKTEMPLSTSYTSHASTSDSKSSDQNANSTKNYPQPQISREDFNELKSKLSVLKNILEDQKADDENDGCEQSLEDLSHENQLLRQELLERDRIIESLRKQLASTSVKN